ncbi:MAG: family protein phosphatase, partial [Actinomycetota bacterium]|nr:family protein phosphatase [Actinomycetota bacterium]
RITEEEAEGHPQRSLVTRVLTGQEADEPDLAMREARIGDRYLLCTDGLSGFVARETIEEILVQGESPGVTADRLVELSLRAGAPDNVTCIIGDVVDLDADHLPSTSQEVVGAAAEGRVSSTRAIPVSPAEKAAALSRDALGTDGTDGSAGAQSEPSRDADTGLPADHLGWRWVKILLPLALLLTAVAGGGYAAYTWAQHQYYIGEANGHVAIYQGVSQKIGPWELSHVVDESDIALTDLSDFYRGKLDTTVSTANIEDARSKVTDFRVQAIKCQTTKAAGGNCGTSKP